MPIKVVVTDLQTHILYRGSLRTGIVQGKCIDVELDSKPGRVLRIGTVRGWLMSLDSQDTYYVFDTKGKRFKIHAFLPKVIDSKP